jgi:hypothetical protein
MVKEEAIKISGENLKDTRIPRISYSQEWMCVWCGLYFDIILPVQHDFRTCNKNGLQQTLFIYILALTSVYQLTVALDHTQWHTHTHARTRVRTESARLVCKRDQPNTANSTCQHTTLITNIHAPSGIRTLNPTKRAASGPCLRPRGHRDRLHSTYKPMFWRFIKCTFSAMYEN